MGETIHVGRRIKERVAQMPELTAKALAAKMNMHEQTLYDVYRRSSVDTDKLLLFSEILKVPLTYFFTPYDDGKENKTPTVKTEGASVAAPGGSAAYSSSGGTSGTLLSPPRAVPSSVVPEARPVSEPAPPTPVAPAFPPKFDESAALRQELQKLTEAFDAFRRSVEIQLSELQRQIDELKTTSDASDPRADERLWAAQEQRIRELEALNAERSLLLQALLKRHL